MANSPATCASETKIIMADPTPLGVFGLALVTLVAGAQKMGWVTGTAHLIPWAIFLGSVAQLWAAGVDFRKCNLFGATALGVYGLFWMGVAMHWAISLGWFGDVGPQATPSTVGFAFLGYFIISVFITVASFETNRIFAAILVLIDVLFLSLTVYTLGSHAEIFGRMAAVSELTISALGFYAGGAIFLNGFYGREVLWLGKPFGLIAKGAVAPARVSPASPVPGDEALVQA